MKIVFFVFSCVLMFFSLVGCTMDVGQPASATPFSEVLSASPTSPVSTTNNTSPPSNQTIPITWADLNLSGRLVYSTVSAASGNSAPEIQILDLGTGEIKTIFAATENAWIYYLTTSSDAQQVIMSYTPPSQPGVESTTSLYVLPLKAEALPQILFTPPTSFDRYTQVEWAPDGQSIYFVSYNHNLQPADQPYPDFQISRMAYPGGQPEKILEHAFWPRVSSDSSKLVYVSLDPVSGTNQLFVANADGSNAQEILLSGLPSPIIDAPIFSPDGQSILFSAPVPPQAYQPNWFDHLMGVQIAKAHNVPSDWWSVPISGGTVTRLTQIQTIKLFASISPDKKYIASLSGEGIFVMDPDGSNVTQLLFDPGISSPVSWMP
jgi:Tol biopolymer transport system component